MQLSAVGPKQRVGTTMLLLLLLPGNLAQFREMAAKERGLSDPIGTVKALPDSLKCDAVQQQAEGGLEAGAVAVAGNDRADAIDDEPAALE
jgi:hypothetical protein